MAALTHPGQVIIYTVTPEPQIVAVARILDGVYACSTSKPEAVRLTSTVNLYNIASRIFEVYGTSIARVRLVGTTEDGSAGWPEFTAADLATALANWFIKTEVSVLTEGQALAASRRNGNTGVHYCVVDQNNLTMRWHVSTAWGVVPQPTIRFVGVNQLPDFAPAVVASFVTLDLSQGDTLTLWSPQGLKQEHAAAFANSATKSTLSTALRGCQIFLICEWGAERVLEGAIK